MQAQASVFNGKVQSFKQPDGTMVDVKLFGTEYYMRGEGLDGYTVIRDAATNYICYAKLSADGSQLISTGIVYAGVKNNMASLKNNLPFAKHIDVNEKSRNKTINQNITQLGATASRNNFKMPNAPNVLNGTPINPVSGNIKGLCIVVDFSDEPGTLPISDFVDFCNGLNYTGFGNNGSLRQYYSDISGGLLDYENEVFGYFRAPLTFAAYDAMPYAVGAQQILGLALNWIDAQGFDFSTLSINPDSTITAINLMYTGYPPVWAQGMWHHKGTYTNFSADGVSTYDYNCSPANSPLELAVVAHENGHMIGKWPDTYKYNSTTGPDGIGAFDLMCWYGDYHNPTIPNPLFLNNAGWATVIDVTNYNGINIDTANSRVSYLYRNINDTNEFFLFQNRMQFGRSTYIDDEGLTVWHIDRNGDNQTTHHEVFLEHANNNYNNQNVACFTAGVYDEFSATTTPNSNFYNGDPSGLRIWDIGAVNDPMTYKLGIGAAGPDLNLQYINITNDNNANGYLEAAESGDFNVNVINNGQINSANAIVTCMAVGVNSVYVTINTAAVNAGVINVSQQVPAAFSVSLDPATPLGTQYSLRFAVSDGVDSIYITKNFTAGVTVTMSNNTDTVCSAIYYDPGALSNYSDYMDFTQTFFPVVSTDKVRVDFNSFNLEYEVNCNYDYLRIYNGFTVASPFLIGEYCGINSPGIITSTHSSGALTFVFHSDEGVTDSGWVAEISCINPLGISNVNSLSNSSLSPNPTSGITYFNAGNAAGVVTVLDVTGRQVFTKEFTANSRVVVDLSNQANGMYQLKLQTEKDVAVKKVVVSRR